MRGLRRGDAIREIANIGAGHAATSLSELTGQRVMISVPRISWGGADEAIRAVVAADAEARIVSVSVPIGQDAQPSEHARLVLDEDTARRVTALMLRREAAEVKAFDLLERSTLAELGNIVTAAYVGVLGSFTGTRVMIGIPEFCEGTVAEFRALLGRGLLIEAEFSFPDATVAGILLLSHAEASFAAVLEALGLEDAPA
jgi:chemotaxis protein CheC